MDIVVWLRSLGLGKYEAAFRENDIDESVLPSLTHETLKERGDIVKSREHFDQAIALYDPAKHRTFATRFGRKATQSPIPSCETQRTCRSPKISRPSSRAR
jgi:SAM domain (Sterile alpha motif)